MKTSRDQLKALMKEILVEILSEGLGNMQSQASPPRQTTSIRGSISPSVRSKTSGRGSFDPRLDTPIGNRTPSDALREAVNRESGGNPLMADLLADTAVTTLASQLSHGDNMGQPSPGGTSVSRHHLPVQQEQFTGDPTQIFGEGGQVREDGSSHWADLAFNVPNKKSA